MRGIELRLFEHPTPSGADMGDARVAAVAVANDLPLHAVDQLSRCSPGIRSSAAVPDWVSLESRIFRAGLVLPTV